MAICISDNICLFEGKAALFDAIEFKSGHFDHRRLYDLAFLADGSASSAGSGLFANLVMNRYLDRTGEDDGLPALPPFLSVRAAIRAHVLARGAGEAEDAASGWRRARTAATRTISPWRCRCCAPARRASSPWAD